MTEEAIHLFVAIRILLYLFVALSLVISSVRYVQDRKWAITAVHVVTAVLFLSLGTITFLHFSGIIKANTIVSNLVVTPVLALLASLVWAVLISWERQEVKRAEDGKENGHALDSA